MFIGTAFLGIFQLVIPLAAVVIPLAAVVFLCIWLRNKKYHDETVIELLAQIQTEMQEVLALIDKRRSLFEARRAPETHGSSEGPQ